MRLLLDTNVVLDVLAARQEWLEESAAVLGLVEAGEAEGRVAAHTVTTLEYLLKRHLSAARASAVLVDLLEVVRAVSVDHERLLEALSLGWPDFEDAVQAVCAVAAGADYIVTRNPTDFKAVTIPAVTPAELLAVLAGEEDE